MVTECATKPTNSIKLTGALKCAEFHGVPTAEQAMYSRLAPEARQLVERLYKDGWFSGRRWATGKASLDELRNLTRWWRNDHDHVHLFYSDWVVAIVEAAASGRDLSDGFDCVFIDGFAAAAAKEYGAVKPALLEGYEAKSMPEPDPSEDIPF